MAKLESQDSYSIVDSSTSIQIQHQDRSSVDKFYTFPRVVNLLIGRTSVGNPFE